MHLDLNLLNHLEHDLYDYLKPVDPDPDFIDTLSQRLLRSDRTVLGRPVSSRRLLWSLFGLMIMVILVVLLILDGRDKH